MEKKVLTEFYKKYSRGIYLYLYGLSHDRFLSEDLMQEAFTKAILSFSGSHEGLKGWLYKVARNLYFNAYKSGKKLVYAEDDDNMEEVAESAAEPLNKLITRERDEEVYKAIYRLDIKKREVLLMHYISGFSQKEIARILGISGENVRVLAHRGKKEVKKYLEEAGYDL